MTPVIGSSLGARAFTYDVWGRPLTATDGAGTTSYGYDQMDRLTSRANTAGGGTITYTYDKASNLASTTDTRRTTSYAFDTSNVPTSLTYRYNSGNHVLAFATDDRGRRTDIWMDANTGHTTWAAHSHTDYDTTGRVTRTTSQVGTGDTDNRPVMDLTYCHAAGSTAPTCPATASADRSNIQWVKDNLTNAVTAYTYDRAGQLTKAAVTGGTAPPPTLTRTTRGGTGSPPPAPGPPRAVKRSPRTRPIRSAPPGWSSCEWNP
ncbi:hypothetical protein [Arthrobacter sp. A5]|uniref:hypothetical protein n=1 Tax=Arthrobacter sp. A5 TaxID=576926 RepID=UPI003DA82FCB